MYHNNIKSAILSYKFRGDDYKYTVDFKVNKCIDDIDNQQIIIAQDDYTYMIYKNNHLNKTLQINCLKCRDDELLACEEEKCLDNCSIFHINNLILEFNNKKILKPIVKVEQSGNNLPCDILYEIIPSSNIVILYDNEYTLSDGILYYERPTNIILSNVKYIYSYECIKDTVDILAITKDDKFYEFKDGYKINEILIDLSIYGVNGENIIYLDKSDQLINLNLESNIKNIYRTNISKHIKGKILIIQPYYYLYGLRGVFIFTTEKYLYYLNHENIFSIKYERDIINITPYIFEHHHDDFNDYLTITNLDSSIEIILLNYGDNVFDKCHRKILNCTIN